MTANHYKRFAGTDGHAVFKHKSALGRSGGTREPGKQPAHGAAKALRESRHFSKLRWRGGDGLCEHF